MVTRKSKLFVLITHCYLVNNYSNCRSCLRYELYLIQDQSHLEGSNGVHVGRDDRDASVASSGVPEGVAPHQVHLGGEEQEQEQEEEEGGQPSGTESLGLVSAVQKQILIL